MTLLSPIGSAEWNCKKHNHFRLNPLANLKLMNIARKSVGLGELSGSDGKSHTEHVKYVESVFAVAHGVALYNISGVPMSYVRIYKAANNDILENLNNIHYQAIRHKVLRYMYGNVATSEDGLRYWVQSVWHRYSVPSFTFVREPLSHFSSGFREYLSRCPGDVPGASPIITKHFVRTAILGILTNNVSQCGNEAYSMAHVFPMSGVLRPYLNIHFIGHLEKFAEDWKGVENMYNISLPLNTSLGSHESSHDVHGVNAAVRDLFDSEPGFLQAVCALLYYDFECFEYILPESCQHLKKEDWMT